MNNPIYPCLWFDGQAQAAAQFYCSIFSHAQIVSSTPMVVIFELNGTRFMGLNGGATHFRFNEAVSFVIECADQAEIDHFWYSLSSTAAKRVTAAGSTDPFGVSWQVVPTMLPQLLSNPHKARAVIAALVQMKKLDITSLQNAS